VKISSRKKELNFGTEKKFICSGKKFQLFQFLSYLRYFRIGSRLYYVQDKMLTFRFICLDRILGSINGHNITLSRWPGELPGTTLANASTLNMVLLQSLLTMRIYYHNYYKLSWF